MASLSPECCTGSAACTSCVGVRELGRTQPGQRVQAAGEAPAQPVLPPRRPARDREPHRPAGQASVVLIAVLLEAKSSFPKLRNVQFLMAWINYRGSPGLRDISNPLD